jgi:hypothetical protein
MFSYTLLFFIQFAVSFKVLRDKVRFKPLFSNDLNLSDELKAYLVNIGSSTIDYLTLSLLERATLYNSFLENQKIGD